MEKRKKPGKYSKDKGKVYEREIAAILKNEYGYNTRRTAQFCGKPHTENGEKDNSDVVGLPGIHIECKRYATKGFDYKWLHQAERDSKKSGLIPCVFHRIDREDTVVTLSLENFMELYQKAFAED